MQVAGQPSQRVSDFLTRIVSRAADEPEQALQDLAELFQANSLRDTDRGYVLLQRSALLLEHDRGIQALAEVSEFLSDKPSEFMPQVRFLLGQLYLVNDQPELALQQLQMWEQHVPQELALGREFAIMGYAFLQLDRVPEAIGVLEKAIELAETPQNTWIELLAFAYAQVGQSNDAVTLLEGLIRNAPQEARWWRQLSSIFMMLEDVPKGAAGLVVASHIEELVYEDSRRLAGLFSYMNMPFDGATLLTATFERYPEEVTYEDQMLQAEMWILAREFDKALSALRAAGARESSGEPALKMAQLYLQREMFGEAREALVESLRYQHEEQGDQVYYLLAVVEINLGDLDAAADALLRLEGSEEYAERAARLNAFVIAQQQVQSN